MGAFVLLAPDTGDPIPVEVMRMVSAQLIEEPELIERLRTGQRDAAVQLLEEKLDRLFSRLHRDTGQRDILVIETGNAVEHRLGCFYHLAQGNTGQERSQPFTRTLRGKTCNISGFPVDEQYLIILIHSYDTIAGIVQDSAEQFGPAPFLK